MSLIGPSRHIVASNDLAANGASQTSPELPLASPPKMTRFCRQTVGGEP